MADQCGFEGNADLYGLGIRIGVYLQWASLQVAELLNLQDESDNIYGAYLIFTTAILIGLFVLTFTETIHVIEIIIMLYLFFGGLLCVVNLSFFSLDAPSFRRSRTWQDVSFFLTWTVASGYGAWFFFHGKSTDHFVHDQCDPLVFFFVKVGPEVFNQSVSKVFGGLSVLGGIVTLGPLIIYPLARADVRWGHNSEKSIRKRMDEEVQQIRVTGVQEGLTQEEIDRRVQRETDRYTEKISQLHPSDPPSEASSISADTQSEASDLANETWTHHLRRTMLAPTRHLGIKLVSLVVIIYSIAGIELMLRWNHIDKVKNVQTIGQLIPFVIGIASFMKVFLEVRKKYKAERKIWKARQKANTPANVAHGSPRTTTVPT